MALPNVRLLKRESMNIRDIFRSRYSETTPLVAQDPGLFILGVDPAGLYRRIAVSAAGAVIISGGGASSAGTATLSNVATNVANVTLLALNAARLGAMVFNDSISDLWLKFGITASATSFTVKILAGGYFEFPSPIYTGGVDGIWSAADATGAARLTEITA